MVRPLFEEWLERRHGVLTFRLTHVMTGTFVFLIQRNETPGCHYSVNHPENTVQNTVGLCPAWAEYGHVLLEEIGGGDLSHLALVEAMVRGTVEE